MLSHSPVPKIILVVAISENRAIGKDNQLLWHLPADLQHFKRITTGHTIIMGRKTYASIGRPLPNRRNIVITRNSEFVAPGVEVVHSMDEALTLCANEAEVYIIGGGELYKTMLPFATQIHLTTVHAIFEGDTFFPKLPTEIWNTISHELHDADENNPFKYTFSLLQRK